MSSGLYTKYNLSEKGLNATSAVQNLYGPRVHLDLLLFAFSSRLESSTSSPDTENDNQLYGLINETISDSQGNITPRTKFVTIGRPNQQGSLQDIYTYSDNNLVWFDKVPSSLDKRTPSEVYGAPIKSSVDGSLVNISIASIGENYNITDARGNLVTLPATIGVNLRGIASKSDSAKIKLKVGANGKIDTAFGVEIINPGNNYIRGEYLEIIPGCNEQDTPSEDLCLLYNETFSQNATYTQSGTNTITVTLISHNLSNNDTVTLDFTSGTAPDGSYVVTVTGINTFTVQSTASTTTSGTVVVNRNGGSLKQQYFVNGLVSTKALLKNEVYTYRVLFADRDGFFLFDDKSNEYVYLGSFYDTLNQIAAAVDPLLVIKRADELSSDNLIQLYNLNGRSAFWTFNQIYQSGESISSEILSLSDITEVFRDSFKLFVQNTKQTALETSEFNTLGTQYNILEGKSINSNFRIIFRDPDGVLDQTVYDKSGTYSQSGNTITITSNGHGLSSSSSVYLLFTSGSAVNGKFTITVTGVNTFTVATDNNITTSGNVNIVKGVSFSQLSFLNSPGETNFAGQNIPGIWLWTGEKYQRVFSSDEKAFISISGKKYLSPAIYAEGGTVELSETGENKYSISASYLKPGTSVVKGFNTILNTLIQNISGPNNPNNGGFVYYRTLQSDTVRDQSPSYIVKAWPLFSYREGNLIKNAKLLAI